MKPKSLELRPAPRAVDEAPSEILARRARTNSLE
jgi:hypothetical protein